MRFEAEVLDIKTYKSTNFISFASDCLTLSCINLQNPKELKIKSKVILGFKSADVMLCKDLMPLLSANVLKVRLIDKKCAPIISLCDLQSLKCQNFCFQALLDSQSAQQIAPNDELHAYIGYTSLFIDEILC